MKVWNNLYFEITKDDGSILELGKNKYAIMDSKTLFENLFCYKDSLDEREIKITCYLGNTANDNKNIGEFADFFEVSDKNTIYRLRVYFDNKIYNAKVKSDDEPFSIDEIEDLYGSVVATVEVVLVMEEPFFYSDLAYSKNIGVESVNSIRFPINFLKDNKNFIFGYKSQLIPHVIENKGSEDNGVYITIVNQNKLINPTITNETTGYSMGFNLELEPKSILEIDTIEKVVYVNGEYVPNAKKLFDSWLFLIKGNNTIMFSAESGAETSDIELKYFDKYRSLVQKVEL